MERVISAFGLLVMVVLAWLLSSHKRNMSWRIIIGGTLLQFAFGLLILGTTPGRQVFDAAGNFFTSLLGFVEAGTSFLFDVHPRSEAEQLPPSYTLWRSFAFGVLPTVIFFSSLMAVLYHLGIMQRVVQVFSWVMRAVLGTSGAETLSVAANVFVGQTEAPLVIRPYVAGMTQSELFVLMVGGFATVAGGVLGAYVGMGIDAGHLITASVISAPAAILIAKVMEPEMETPKTLGHVDVHTGVPTANAIEAAAEGASTGMMLAINVAAMLIAFVALVAMVNAIVAWTGTWFGYEGAYAWSLDKGFGYAFAPFAWLMGIEWNDCRVAGQLLGTKTVLNEFLAYSDLSEIMKGSPNAKGELSDRSAAILTYALCGFSNFSSIGIQIGGIGTLAPTRRTDLARLGLRAMIGGTLACFMTACVAGVLL